MKADLERLEHLARYADRSLPKSHAENVRAAIAELSANRAAGVGVNVGVPYGWALVPRTATNEMTKAGDDADSEHDGFGDYYGQLWAAMVDAAPEPSTNVGVSAPQAEPTA